jgi:methyl-accepting chemotaxis protein
MKIREIVQMLGNLEHSASTIAVATEEQHAVTADLAANVERTSSLADGVRGEVSLVVKTATESSATVAEALSTARSLAGLSDDLARATTVFIERVRVA